ncbi:hotdog fold domain-containing protein [Acinetobacter colistiniresistens]|nr:hotdog fold domain-containing protein [Acinetobacter colistiniresistens]
MKNSIDYLSHKLKKHMKIQTNTVLIAYQSLRKIPGGLTVLSRIISRVAPYFRTVNPVITKLEVGLCEASMSKSRSIENHIGTVHVIAICNGLEFVMGVAMEASIPSHLRWLPKGMQVDYVAKANSDIQLTAKIINDDWRVGDMQVEVIAKREDGEPVVQGCITIWVTEKK